MRDRFRTLLFSSVIATGCVLALASVWVSAKHLEAQAFLDRIDFQARQASGATFYARPKRLAVGLQLPLSRVVEHLSAIGFVADDGSHQSGSFHVQGNVLLVNPRLPEFRPVQGTFRRGRISRIVAQPAGDGSAAEFQPVHETTIEPEPLGSFILTVDGPDRSKMFVRRRVIKFEDLDATPLFDALLASEDTRFMRHNGTRFDRIIRSVLPGGVGGGSTLTAQFVKNAVSLDREHSIRRKIDEIFIAASLEARMSKQEILAGYANHVFLGGGPGVPNIYGFGAAAQEYFGKSEVRELSLAEASTLVAMLPRPNSFLQAARSGDLDQLQDARDRVLARVRKVWPDKYSVGEINRAQSEELRFVQKPSVEQPLDIVSRPFVEFASQRQPLLELDSLSAHQLSGIHVYTSLDPDLARMAQKVLDAEIPEIQRRFPAAGGGTCSAGEDRLLGSIVALDPMSGEIIVMAGSGGGKDGITFSRFALNAEASIASTQKPFAVAAALEATVGLNPYTAATIVPSQPPSRVRAALARSDEDLADFTMDRAGIDSIVRVFERATGNVAHQPTREFGLGFGAGTEISALRHARAYSMFANGRAPAVVPINAVYLDGKPIPLRKMRPVRVLDSGAAFITVQMMRSVLGYGGDGIHGTGRRAAQIAGLPVENLEIGGKTGSGPHAVWMMSVSPRFVVAVLMTYKCHSEIRNAKSLFAADTAAIIWAKFMRSVQDLRPDLLTGRFDRPPNVVEGKINPNRGCLSDGPASVREYFLEGTLPPPCDVSP